MNRESNKKGRKTGPMQPTDPNFLSDHLQPDPNQNQSSPFGCNVICGLWRAYIHTYIHTDTGHHFSGPSPAQGRSREMRFSKVDRATGGRDSNSEHL